MRAARKPRNPTCSCCAARQSSVTQTTPSQIIVLGISGVSSRAPPPEVSNFQKRSLCFRGPGRVARTPSVRYVRLPGWRRLARTPAVVAAYSRLSSPPSKPVDPRILSKVPAVSDSPIPPSHIPVAWTGRARRIYVRLVLLGTMFHHTSVPAIVVWCWCGACTVTTCSSSAKGITAF